MALVKVLALDATGVIETEIDTGSGGGGGGSGSGGSIIKHTIDLTNGQTAVTVPGGYTSAGVAVYLNGAYLSPAEYTATTSPTITLAVGAPSEDSVLDVLVFEVGTPTVTSLTDCNLFENGLGVAGNSTLNTPVPGNWYAVSANSWTQTANQLWASNTAIFARARLLDGVNWGAWKPLVGLTDAPSDTKLYGRKDAAWVEVPTGGAATLNDLTDVIITSAAIDEVLKWNGTNWVNGTPAGGGGGASVGSALPLINGAASAGAAVTASREDHVHPTDTTYGIGGNSNQLSGSASALVGGIYEQETTATNSRANDLPNIGGTIESVDWNIIASKNGTSRGFQIAAEGLGSAISGSWQGRLFYRMKHGGGSWVNWIEALTSVSLLSGFTTASSVAVTAADTIIGALGKLQAQVTNAFNRTNHSGTQLASTISNFATTVLSTALTGLNTATASLVIATDSVLSAIGKLQAQITQRAYTFISVGYQAGTTYTLNTTTDLTYSILLGHGTSTVVSVPQGSTLYTGARYTISGFSTTGVHVVNMFSGDTVWNPDTGLSNSTTFTVYPGDVLQLTRLGTATQWVSEIIRRSAVVAGSGISVTRDSLNRYIVANAGAGAPPTRANLWTTGLSQIWMQQAGVTYVGLGGIYAWVQANSYNLPVVTTVSGAGAAALISNYNLVLTTGSTASGASSAQCSPQGYGYFTNPGGLGSATGGCYFSFTMAAGGVLSNATDRFELYAALGPQTPNHNTWAQCGISILYSDNLNSGNYVIKYSNADGSTITTINTAVAFNAAGKPIIISIDKTGVSTCTITVSIDGSVVATITDSAANTNAGPFIFMASFFKITKLLGTTNILASMTNPRSGWAV